MAKKVLIVGSGLGGLSTALRLAHEGFDVEIVENNDTPGGRLNQVQHAGYTFDMGPTFFSMSYEFKELMQSCKEPMPFKFIELDPLYTVNFRGSDRRYTIYKDLARLAQEFGGDQLDFQTRLNAFLLKVGRLYHDTEYRIIKRNFESMADYIYQLSRVPLRYLPLMFKSMWSEMTRYISDEEARIIFSLVGFFLGSTPFDTPAVFCLLTYIEMQHDGYHNVEGGMYKIVEGMIAQLNHKKVSFHYNTEIVDFIAKGKKLQSLIDQNGRVWDADVFVINSDAAFFRGSVFRRKAFNEEKLDRMSWTMGPLTLYMGLKGKVPELEHHNYFLGSDFKQYSMRFFKNTDNMAKPYYYVNVPSRNNLQCAPVGCESIFILAPVPNLLVKPSWNDRDKYVDMIIDDLSQRIGADIRQRTETLHVMDPIDWGNKFNLYKGSGLGLSHNLKQLGYLRPKNKDEKYDNTYYVGASTVPGTGLPMAVISSRLVSERILKDYGTISEK